MKNLLIVTTLIASFSTSAATDPCFEGTIVNARAFAAPSDNSYDTQNLDVPAQDPRCQQKPWGASMYLPETTELVAVDIRNEEDFVCALDSVETVSFGRGAARKTYKAVHVRVLKGTEDLYEGCRVIIRKLDGQEAVVMLVVQPD